MALFAIFLSWSDVAWNTVLIGVAASNLGNRKAGIIGKSGSGESAVANLVPVAETMSSVLGSSSSGGSGAESVAAWISQFVQ